jgi:cobalt-zinc-cadmium efflux system outer membrane protein
MALKKPPAAKALRPENPKSAPRGGERTDRHSEFTITTRRLFDLLRHSPEEGPVTRGTDAFKRTDRGCRWAATVGAVLAAALFMTAASLPGAEASESRSLTLEQAVTQALEHHPAVLQAQKEIDAARGRLLQLEAAPNPELSFEAVGLPLWNSKGEKEFSLGLHQLVEYPGKRSARRELGLAGEESARLALERVRNVVRGRVERAYFRAAYAQRRRSDLESLLATLRQYVDLAAERYRTGQVPYLDVVRGRLETLRLQNEIVEAGRDLKAKTLALGLLMGEKGFEPTQFLTAISYAPLAGGLDELQTEALAGSTLKLAASAEKEAGLSLAVARKAGLPDFSIGLFLPSKRLGGWGVEFGLTLPLRRSEFRGMALEAEAASGQARIRSEADTRRVAAALAAAYEDARALEAQIGLFQGSLLREVEESLQAGLTSYQFGKTDSLGVLDLVRGLKETRAEFLRALLNHKLALVDITMAGEDESAGVDGADF